MRIKRRFVLRRPEDIPSALRIISEHIKAYSGSDRDLHAVRLSMEEAIINAIKHGNGSDSAKTVRIRCSISRSWFVAIVEDEGPGFDPSSIPDPTDPEYLERPGGRGLFIMKHYMDWVRYNRAGNIIALGKRLSRM